MIKMSSQSCCVVYQFLSIKIDSVIKRQQLFLPQYGLTSDPSCMYIFLALMSKPCSVGCLARKPFSEYYGFVSFHV